MSWFADLAGKAESLLNNLDEQTGAALRNHNVGKKSLDKNEFSVKFPTEATLGPKRRPVSRNSRKNGSPGSDVRSLSPVRKLSPPPVSHIKEIKSPDPSKNSSAKRKNSPIRKAAPVYTLHNCPKTLVGDVSENDSDIEHFGLKQRRSSLPSDLKQFQEKNRKNKIQSLEIENTLMKNELNVMNREVLKLLNQLSRTEDGNDVDTQELTKSNMRFDATQRENHQMFLDKHAQSLQLEQLKYHIDNFTKTNVQKYIDQNDILEAQIQLLRNNNKDLEDRNQMLNNKLMERDQTQLKLENDVRHAQSTANELQINLTSTAEECKRLERDWEAYKLRVKNMLIAKDNEIKALQEGVTFNEDTKVLMDQIESLKKERDELSDAVSNVRSESNDMKLQLQQVEARHSSAEHVVSALRDALREERSARNRSEAQNIALSKELKSIQMENAQTVATLRTTLRDRENELNNLRETISTVRTSDTNALNVADYDVIQDSLDNDKIRHLTQTLVQRQTKIDNLLAENNTLKIQMEKLESKYKSEISSLRTNFNHSVVQFQDGDMRSRSRTYTQANVFSTLSLRLGVMVKRYPIIRIFIMLYMICLHFWVLTVLFTSTPEDFVPRSTKS